MRTEAPAIVEFVLPLLGGNYINKINVYKYYIYTYHFWFMIPIVHWVTTFGASNNPKSTGILALGTLGTVLDGAPNCIGRGKSLESLESKQRRSVEKGGFALLVPLFNGLWTIITWVSNESYNYL